MKPIIRKAFFVTGGAIFLALLLWWTVPRINFTGNEPGIVLDSLDGVYVYNNGAFGAVYGRNLSETGYNIGLKYQCVEFVKRYYLEHYGHRMPESYGHARDFFDDSVPDSGTNRARGLHQFRNGSAEPPRRGDILVFGPTIYNPYGHVAIVSSVGDGTVEIIQQNDGTRTRVSYKLTVENGIWQIGSRSLRGWLRIKE